MRRQLQQRQQQQVSGTTTSAVNIASSSKPCTYKFALITHGDNGNFWSVVYKGAKDAAADLGCTLTETYGSQQQGQAEPDDNAENAQIQNAINAHVDGMAISDHDPSLMNPTIKSAAAKGIPVVLLNAGCDDQDIAASGAMTCVGQPEQLAGQAVGGALQAAGRHQRAVRHPPVGPEPARPLQRHRAGPRRRPAVQAGQRAVEGTGLHRADPVDAQRGLQPAAGDRPGHLVPAVPPADQRGDDAQQRHRHGPGQRASQQNVKIATFDLSTDVENELKAGTLAFAVDQQQYLQGYLPIQFLYLYKKHEGQSVGGGTTVASGPLLVGQDQHRQGVGRDRGGRRLTHHRRHGKPRSRAGRGSGPARRG